MSSGTGLALLILVAIWVGQDMEGWFWFCRTGQDTGRDDSLSTSTVQSRNGMGHHIRYDISSSAVKASKCCAAFVNV